MNRLIVFFALILFGPLLSYDGTALAQSDSKLGEQLELRDIFHEPFIPGNRPSFSHFGTDAKAVYYSWSDSLSRNRALYKVGLTGKNTQKVDDDNLPRNFALSPDGDKVLYTQRGDLYIAEADFSNSRKIVGSKAFDFNPVWKSDSKQFAFIQNGNVWISGTEDAFLLQITDKEEDAPSYSIVEWAGDSKLVLSQWDTSDYKEYYFPEYVDTYVETGASSRGIPSRILSIAYVDSNRVDQLFKRKGWVDVDVSAHGDYMAVDWADSAMKKREIILYNLVDNKEPEVVFHDETEGWLHGRNMQFAPLGSKLMFQSEKDGWNHVYTVEPGMRGIKQHTFNDYDVPWAEWVDSDQMVIATSKNDPGDIQLYLLDLNNNLQTQLTREEGHRRDFNLSPDRRYVVYSKTFFNQPFELYLTDIKIPNREVKLTNTVPESFNEYDWQKEDYVRFRARDGETMLSMSVLKPLKRNPNGNPVVVFVHGAGSLQNVYKGWSSSYWREYLFNQYLTTKGYYVIEVDYRHSTGYGRKFREDVTDWMGKYETMDIEDGLAFLADNYDKADTSKVGIYGGSYGGFMALYAVSVSPEHFDAAAALRSVTNWENYFYTNPWYTLPRLGTPAENPEHYERSSPISYADSLKKPVLILHGLIDNNVGFQDAAQYIERLIQNEHQPFEMMMYPSERHSFSDEDAWYDEYRRIYSFFEEHLKESE